MCRKVTFELDCVSYLSVVNLKKKQQAAMLVGRHQAVETTGKIRGG